LFLLLFLQVSFFMLFIFRFSKKIVTCFDFYFLSSSLVISVFLFLLIFFLFILFPFSFPYFPLRYIIVPYRSLIFALFVITSILFFSPYPNHAYSLLTLCSGVLFSSALSLTPP
jgi:hypothetical protein